MDWLKRNLINTLIQIFLTFIMMLIMFHYQDGYTNESELKKKVDRKADIIYVDYQDEKIKKEFKEYNEGQDKKVETMRIEWREDQKEILSLIREKL